MTCNLLNRIQKLAGNFEQFKGISNPRAIIDCLSQTNCLFVDCDFPPFLSNLSKKLNELPHWKLAHWRHVKDSTDNPQVMHTYFQTL